MERNVIVKVIKIKKKEYFENMIDCNNPIIMWNILKKIIRGKPGDNREKKDINFESLNNITECNIVDKFNLRLILCR